MLAEYNSDSEMMKSKKSTLQKRARLDFYGSSEEEIKGEGGGGGTNSKKMSFDENEQQ